MTAAVIYELLKKGLASRTRGPYLSPFGVTHFSYSYILPRVHGVLRVRSLLCSAHYKATIFHVYIRTCDITNRTILFSVIIRVKCEWNDRVGVRGWMGDVTRGLEVVQRMFRFILKQGRRRR